MRCAARCRSSSFASSSRATRSTGWGGARLRRRGGARRRHRRVDGLINLSAVPPHPDGWAHLLLHYGMEKSVARHADPPASSEPLDSPAMIMRGAATYSVVCANCHGGPGLGQSPVAFSMRPEPPMVIDATSRYSDKELFFIVANGVRYSGMPAYPVQNRPDEIWALVSFLKTTPKMSRETYLGLAHGSGPRARRSRLRSPMRPPRPPRSRLSFPRRTTERPCPAIRRRSPLRRVPRSFRGRGTKPRSSGRAR